MRLFLVLLMLVSGSTQAVDFEIGAGRTQFSAQQDGVWYQNPFPYDLELQSNSVSLGITDYVQPGWRYRAGWWYVGRATSSALAVGADAVYAAYGKEAGQHYPLTHWYGQGTVNELYATVGPEWQVGSFTLAAEGGFTLCKSTWTESMPDFVPLANNAQGYGSPYPLTVQNAAPIHGGYMYGVSVGYGRTSLALTRTSARTSGDWPGIYTGEATNLSVRVRF